MKELNEKDTLVIRMVWVCGMPTVKSYYVMKKTVTYLEEDLVRLGYK